MARTTKPTIRTGRMTTFVMALVMVLITGVLAVANFIGMSESGAFILMESIGLLGAGVMLLLEVFMEGKRTGLQSREYTLMDIIGAIIGLGVVVLGLGGLIGNLTGSPVLGLPNAVKGLVLVLLPALLLHELFSQ